MSLTYQILLYSHIAVGFASLVLFWIPVAAKKGSAFHTRSGHWYAKAMYAVGFSALIMSLMLMTDPISFKFAERNFTAEQTASVIAEMWDIGLFLLAISILVLVGVRHGLLSVRAKKNHELMRRPAHMAVNIALLAIGVWLGITATGNSPLSVLFYIFAGLCIVTAVGNLRYCLKAEVTRGEQIIAHLSSIIGAGIGSHTAFFVFGASRMFAELLTGYMFIVPWVLPTVVGTVIIARQSRKYRPRKVTQLAHSS